MDPLSSGSPHDRLTLTRCISWCMGHVVSGVTVPCVDDEPSSPLTPEHISNADEQRIALRPPSVPTGSSPFSTSRHSDYEMHGTDGLECLETVRARDPDSRFSLAK